MLFKTISIFESITFVLLRFPEEIPIAWLWYYRQEPGLSFPAFRKLDCEQQMPVLAPKPDILQDQVQ